jgi:hypothetical protein
MQTTRPTKLKKAGRQRAIVTGPELIQKNFIAETCITQDDNPNCLPEEIETAPDFIPKSSKEGLKTETLN